MFSRRVIIQGIVLCSLSLVISSMVILTYWNGNFKQVDNFFYDLHIKYRGIVPVSKNIVLVLMDDKSGKVLGYNRGGWSRKNLAVALGNLCSAEAEIIGLDMVLASVDSEPGVDEFLAQTIDRCNNVILGRASSGSENVPILPLTIFQESAIGDGFLDVMLDEDEVLRKIQYLNAKPIPGGDLMLLPSFSLELARTFLDLDFQFDFGRENFILMGEKTDRQIRLPYPHLNINYTGDYTNFITYSYGDIVKNNFDPEMIKNKLILIGSSLTSQKDFFVTPFSRFKHVGNEFTDKFAAQLSITASPKDPGVACHAYAVNTILTQQYISKPSFKITVIILLLTALLGLLFYLPGISIYRCIVLLIFMVTVALALTQIIFNKFLLIIDLAPVLTLILGQFLSGAMVQRYFVRKRMHEITGLFGRYVSPAVVKKLVNEDAGSRLAGHRAEVSVLFSDIRNFTSIAERLDARATGKFLNSYFEAMIPVIFAQDGTLDKLIGDAIMAFWGDPVSSDDHACKAATTALIMLDKLAEINQNDTIGCGILDIGIGIDSGEVTAGNLGCQQFVDYTVVGDTVNSASRLEGLNKVYGTHILLTEAAKKQLNESFVCRKLDLVMVKGKNKAVLIYELCCFKDNLTSERAIIINKFEKALDLFHHREWNKAAELFQNVLGIRSDDVAAGLFLQRIDHYRIEPPDDKWQGETRFLTK